MKKTIISILFIFAVSLSLSGQDITGIFLKIPNDVLFGVDATNKNKLIDRTIGDTTSVSVESALGGDITRTAISDTYMRIETSSVGTLQLKLLPLVNNSMIVAVIRTVCGKACDSQIQFYSTNWAHLKDINLMPKTDINWFISADADRNSEDFQHAIATLDMIPVKIEANAENTDLTIKCDVETYLSEGDFKAFEPYYNSDAKTLSWDKISFK